MPTHKMQSKLRFEKQEEEMTDHKQIVPVFNYLEFLPDTIGVIQIPPVQFHPSSES
jgi:hypothetical protein